MSGPQTILPMKAAGTQHFIDRTYRESGTFQWVRETFTNAIEAGANRVEFGIEWQAVESLGVYRRTIADNGRGMTADELVEFFNTFGGGGKPIGGPHENFGVGAKTSLLPWNRYGLVVVSWVEGEPAMIWVKQDSESGEFGLRLFQASDPENQQESLEEVITPFYDEEHGCDWSKVRPDWLEDNGTVVILLGNDPMDDTVVGDPNRSEADIKGVSTYLNRRIWELAEGTEVYVDELRTGDRSKWPRNLVEARGSQPKHGYDRRTNLRRIEGARHYIEYKVPSSSRGSISASGTVGLQDGTDVDWYLWDGERPAVQSYAAISGYIGALYENELYDVTSHASTYRSFGISEGDVRRNLWLILRPPVLSSDGSKSGVYPRTDRNSLLLKGGPSAGQPLPVNDWGAEFSDLMPDAIRDAIRAARGGAAGSVTDSSWRERLQERFGSLWRIVKLRTQKGGSETLDPTQGGTSGRRPKPVKRRQRSSKGGEGGGRSGRKNTGSQPGPSQGRRTKVAGGIPAYRLVREADIGEPGILASWQPHDPEVPEGVVLINVEHPVLEAQIERWQSLYADHHADEIRKEVLQAYGEIAVAKVAHSEHLKSVLPAATVEQKLRSNEALTMSLLGLIAEEAVLSPRIGGKFGRKRSA